MKYLIVITTLISSLFSMNCSDYKDFQLYNGHYYSISIDKLTFESAKQIAINNGGTLAVPNDAAENTFIKNLLGGGSVAWIGIHDPNKIENYCYTNDNCSYDSTRFKDINNNTLSYKNFNAQQPDNLVKAYDVIDGKTMVNPLGEFWVAMSGNNGEWLDAGNHADEYNNPVKYKAVFEFENLNDCTPPTDDPNTTLSERFCNTKVWDENVDTVTMGQTVECQNDAYGNEYCPEALADAGEYWDYDDGWSVENVGFVVDYTNKVSRTVTIAENELISNFSKPIYQTTAEGFGTTLQTSSTEGALYGYSSVSSFSNSKPIYQTTAEGFGTTLQTSSTEGALYGYVSLTSGTQYKTTTQTKTIESCPTGYTETTGAETSKGECKKTISYTYYKYLCLDEQNEFNENYTPTVSTTDIVKIDSDNTSINEDTLNDTVGSSIPPTDNCIRQGFTCNSDLRVPAWVNDKWQCSPFPCLGESNFNNLDTNVGSSDKNNDGWDDDGSCSGTIHIFNGKSNQCRSWDMFFGLAGGGCCDKDKVAAGLVECKENEKLLATKREKEHTHYIGNFCSKELDLKFTKICIQKSDSYCAFNSKLARIIQEQGREQLNISWGSSDNPECRGFTPDEFQKLDFSKIDLSEFVEEIQSNIQTNVIDNLGGFVKDRVEGFYDEN